MKRNVLCHYTAGPWKRDTLLMAWFVTLNNTTIETSVQPFSAYYQSSVLDPKNNQTLHGTG